MPEISRFHGITVRMYFDDRHHPHFHTYYGEFVALFTIDPPALYEGSMPRRQLNIILGWAEVHQQELIDNWNQARLGLPTAKIEGRI